MTPQNKRPNGKAYGKVYCSDCGKSGAATCNPCKAERRRLHALHAAHDDECEADRERKPALIASYAARIAAGLPLFEE